MEELTTHEWDENGDSAGGAQRMVILAAARLAASRTRARVRPALVMNVGVTGSPTRSC